jgi:hypothetical protein
VFGCPAQERVYPAVETVIRSIDSKMIKETLKTIEGVQTKNKILTYGYPT